jgi:import inner membrane translocase subunit TIM16
MVPTFLPALPPCRNTPPPANLLTNLLLLQAYRVITQVVLIGSRVLGRAFAEAYKQAAASSQYQRAQAKAGINPTGGRASVAAGMTLEEACKILNVKPPQGGQANMEEVMERFKRLFDANEPTNGGSFYLQSKIVRARERIEAEARPLQEKAEVEAEVKEGWKPKVYKDR